MQKIYDTKHRDLVDFKPLKEGEIGMYVCGPTVQSAPHIGHLRSALVYDVMRRWFLATGNRVTFIRNVTDIDDKILAGAAETVGSENPEEWWALAYRVEKEFTSAYDALGIMAPTYEPRATANVAQMIELIETLIEKGHAYRASNDSANVFFDTKSWSEYGALTKQDVDDMEDAKDADPLGKKNPQDFALWKALKDDEPISASWDSPWGRGRPGWHIECSAMAKRYLGDTFDIHGGGLDLRFPHHENEMAQSRAAGDEFARHWVHNGLVNTGGQKMSKSLGNSLFAHDLLAATRPIVLRYFLMQAHYRSVLDYSEESITEAEAAFGRIESFLMRAREMLEIDETVEAQTATDLPQEFVEAMNDDFGVPQALAVLYGAVRAGNVAHEAADEGGVTKNYKDVIGMLSALGLNPYDSLWAVSDADNSERDAALEAIVEGLVAERLKAREEKDFERSDLIRDQLAAAGVAIEDHATGTRWSLK